MKKIRVNDIADFLRCGNPELAVSGNPDLEISGFSKLDSIRPGTVVFAKKFKEEFVPLLNRCEDVLAIVTAEYAGLLKCSYIVSSNPRLDFIMVLSEFFAPKTGAGSVHPTAVVEEGACVSPDAVIGPFCYISSGSAIGAGTVLHSHVTVCAGSQVGSGCEIKSGAVIGQSGFGFERDADGNPVKFPHFGKVIIGDNVYVGANTCIDQGTLGDTVIEDNAKIDNLVHIAHNCHIGQGAFVIAGAVLGGGTQVGANCWLAPNISIKEQIRIGDRALIGLGAVVIRPVEEGTVMIGNPARKLCK
ncbi:MAG: UDP-3-O-(3-hydroxymyristoyl)glucosamine N-acyltransferase [Bacteroidales bacterium]|nr:UDP-3-O-(3-hydroxymyristoyl)glucosamine N-acyltransferase [Bacteroidales bacterium]